MTITLRDIMKKAWALAKREANRLKAKISYRESKKVKASQYISWALKKSWEIAKGVMQYA